MHTRKNADLNNRSFVKRISLKIPLNYRMVFFVTLAVSWFTGLGFFLLDTFFQIEGEYGMQKHALQSPALTLHGAAAFLMMIWFGGLVAAHVPMGWRTQRLRFWGISLLSLIGLQIVTAYGLYYLSHEISREVIQWVHLIVGGILPFVLVGHIVAGIKDARLRQHSKK
ncbi:MAG: hypothetical protein COA43_05820 [Robiginitomaculum sp.]|nr:MAG: hypothetical protein COA43_05820 [Robiginitomaculum sp.]